MDISRTVLVLRTVLIATLLPVAMRASSINIDFGDQNPVPSSAFGAASGQAGVWNNVNSLGTTNNLVDLTGTPTSISVDVGALTIDGASGNYVAGNDTSALRAD